MKQFVLTSLMVIFLGLSFTTGYFLSRQTKNKKPDTNSVLFNPVKTDRPSLDFFVMSFCPFGNQIENSIYPVSQLLSSKSTISPHYLFEKIIDLNSYCKNKSGDPSACQSYVDNKYFNNLTDCKKNISDSLEKCLQEKSYLKSSDGTLYTSLHGRQEGNQNVREICAWKQADDINSWWKFVTLVNKNCTADTADNCWEQQGKLALLDTNKITECFNEQAFQIIESEIAYATKYKIQGSPSILVNESDFPPENAYNQDGTATLKIGKTVINQSNYRSPNSIKEALCSAFAKTPKECQTVLDSPPSDQAITSGGCIN